MSAATNARRGTGSTTHGSDHRVCPSGAESAATLSVRSASPLPPRQVPLRPARPAPPGLRRKRCCFPRPRRWLRRSRLSRAPARSRPSPSPRPPPGRRFSSRRTSPLRNLPLLRERQRIRARPCSSAARRRSPARTWRPVRRSRARRLPPPRTRRRRLPPSSRNRITRRPLRRSRCTAKRKRPSHGVGLRAGRSSRSPPRSRSSSSLRASWP